jgi:hypothetical protein
VVFISKFALFFSYGVVRKTTTGISDAIRRKPLAILTFTLLSVKVNMLLVSAILEIVGFIIAGAASFVCVFFASEGAAMLGAAMLGAAMLGAAMLAGADCSGSGACAVALLTLIVFVFFDAMIDLFIILY